MASRYIKAFLGDGVIYAGEQVEIICIHCKNTFIGTINQQTIKGTRSDTECASCVSKRVAKSLESISEYLRPKR